MWNLFKVNNEDTILESKFLTMAGFTYCSGVSIVNFEQVNIGLFFFRRKRNVMKEKEKHHALCPIFLY